MKIRFFLLLLLFFFNVDCIKAQSDNITINHFNKVIISPHIQVTFIEGNEESVSIEAIKVAKDKLNIEVNGEVLRIYLDGAKEMTKNEKTFENGQKRKRSLYQGTIATITVSYKNLKELSLRGEETIVCESPLKMEKFRLKIYGESQVIINEVDLESLHTTIYGESFLEIKKGTIDRQKITAYGETKVNTLNANNITAKITAYGEGSYRVNVSENLKVSAYGTATIAYTGTPNVNTGIILGEATIQKIQ